MKGKRNHMPITEGVNWADPFKPLFHNLLVKEIFKQIFDSKEKLYDHLEVHSKTERKKENEKEQFLREY